MRPRIAQLTAIAALAAALTAATSPARADAAAGCPDAALSQPFSQWLDPSLYQLVPGGDFESGNTAWSFDGASTAEGNEPFTVNDPKDHRSLELGDRGSATTPDVCLSIDDPTLRLFVRNSGSPLSSLLVSAEYDGIDGAATTTPLATLTAGSDWQPSAQVPVLLNLLGVPLGSDGATHVRFQFTPLGAGGDWSIDDVYLDPFKTK
jgi:hypothetical protein